MLLIGDAHSAAVAAVGLVLVYCSLGRFCSLSIELYTNDHRTDRIDSNPNGGRTSAPIISLHPSHNLKPQDTENHFFHPRRPRRLSQSEQKGSHNPVVIHRCEPLSQSLNLHESLASSLVANIHGPVRQRPLRMTHGIESSGNSRALLETVKYVSRHYDR